MKILLTGGTSGLGEAVVTLLAKDPAKYIYFTHNDQSGKAAEMEKKYGNSRTIKCDFNVNEDIDSLINMIGSMDIDVLINNAYSGEAIRSHFHKIPDKEFLEGFITNVMPVVRITQAAIELFRKKRSGKIISVLTSYLSNVPPVGSSVYVANKAYIKQLSKVWANENIRFNITSNCISPSFMLTNFTKDTDERMIEQMKENNPLKRILTPQEAAEAVVFLVEASNQINGVDLGIDAGVNIR